MSFVDCQRPLSPVSLLPTFTRYALTDGGVLFSGPTALLLPVAPDATSNAAIAPMKTSAAGLGVRFMSSPFVGGHADGAAPPGRGAAPTGRALLGVLACRAASVARECVPSARRSGSGRSPASASP